MEQNCPAPHSPDSTFHTAYTYAEQALNTPLFYDSARTQQAIDGELLTHQNTERLHLGMDALRLMARARWQNRQEHAEDPAYVNSSKQQRSALVAPTLQQLADIRGQLAPQRQRLEYINRFERHVEKLETDRQASPLRNNQHDVFDALKDFMNRAGAQKETGEVSTLAGYINMPTGTGKTVVAVELVKALGYPKTLILTSRKDILLQTVGNEGSRGFSQFAPETDVTSFYERSKNLDGNVVVMTYASFNNLMTDGQFDPSLWDLVVCDEAHRALGSTTSNNLRSFGEGKIIIGLTATDEYAENKRVDQLLPECIYEISLREAINKGWLSPVQAWLYKTTVEIDKDNRKDFSTAELCRLAEVSGRNQKGIEFAKNFVEQGLQGLVSCIPGENVQHAKDIAAALCDTEVVDKKTGEPRKIIAQELYGDMPDSVRQTHYERFEKGEIDVLTFVDVIGEGWDSHVAKFLVNLRPSCSPVFSTQRFGRILRPTGLGTPAQVVDFIDTTKKAQFTALHALGEYRHRQGRVYGPTSKTTPEAQKRITLPDHLSQTITGVNMRKLADIIVGRPYEPDFSELYTIESVATRLNLAEAALLFIAEQNGFAVEHARGGIGAATTQISEISADKIATMLRDNQYDWLVGKTNDWVQSYIAQRRARVQAVQARIAATVVDSQDTRVRQASRDEAVDQQSTLTAGEEATRAAHNKLMQQYSNTAFNKLVKAVATARISTKELQQIIFHQTKTGTLKVTSAIDLIVNGKQPGVWHDIQASLVEGLFHSPFLGVSALNTAIQLGSVKSVDHNTTPSGRNILAEVSITLTNDEVVTAKAYARDAKTAQQVSVVQAIAKMVDVDTTNFYNPNEPKNVIRKLIEELKADPLELPDIENPKGALLEIFQKYQQQDLPNFYISGVVDEDDKQIYLAEVVFRSRGRRHATYGYGETVKDAQIDGARRALVIHQEALQRVGGFHPDKIARANKGIDSMGPVKFLTRRSEILGVKLPGYAQKEAEDGSGITPQVTIIDNMGVKRTFIGNFVPADKTASKQEMRARIKAARLAACQAAIEILRDTK